MKIFSNNGIIQQHKEPGLHMHMIMSEGMSFINSGFKFAVLFVA